MAEESKFLKWQDQDGDGLIDVCDDLLEPPELPLCLNCMPNPKAIVPDWRKLVITKPFMNEKLCEYQVTKVTPYTTTVDAALLENEEEHAAEIKLALTGRYDEFVDEAIESLLDFYEKDDSDESRAKVKNDIKYSKYELPPRPKSRLKLLYSVPFDTIFLLPPRPPDQEEEEEEEPGEMVVKYNAGELSTKMIRIRKGLNLYGRYLKVYRAIDGGNIFFLEDNRIFNLEQYGDSALFTHSTMSDLLTSLESYLNVKGYQMPGVGGITFFKDKIVNIEFKTNNYELKRIKIWTEGCGEKPIYFNKRKLKPLLAQPSWKDITAIGFLMQLNQMESSLSARVPIPWQEFVIKYTYPKVYSTLDDTTPEEAETVTDCITDALANEAKELGQDILDDVFGLGDAIAYLFHKQICSYDASEVRGSEMDMGLIPADDIGDLGIAPGGIAMRPRAGGKGTRPLPDPNLPAAPAGLNKGNLYGMAATQAFKELNASDQVFAQMCGRVLASMIGWGPARSKMDQLYTFGFERIKQCGLFDLMTDAMRCLLSGLTMEELMASAAKAALESMGIENFGELFVGIPPEKQTELANKVMEKLESGDLGVGRQRERAELQAAGIGLTSPPRPWENQDIIDEERSTRGDVSGTGQYGAAAQQQQQQTRRTLAQQFDVAGSAEEELDTGIVMEAYIKALIEVYSENLMGLIDMLNKFPGAPIIASILASMDCPRPPLFNPSVLDFLKDIDLPWCRNRNDMRLPRIENPLEWLPPLKDILKWLWDRIKEALLILAMNILIKIMVKICQILGDAICKALETVGDIALATPGLLRGTTTMKDVIKESICGPNASEEQVEDTMVTLMTQLGPGGAAMADRSQVMQFAEDVSSSVTRREMADAFLGKPSAEFTEAISQLIEFEYPEYGRALPTPGSVGNMFKNMGNLMPLDFRDQLRDLTAELPKNELMPANPTLCATHEQLDNFKELRCQLLEGRASKEQCDVMYDNLRSGFLEDFDTLGGVMQDFPGHIMANLPPLRSAPGCDDGLIPNVSPATAAAFGTASGNDFEQLKVAYATDMLGNGGFLQGDAGWGFINMVLSDTEGNPLTAHWRKAWNMKSYVNFATNLPNGGDAATGFFAALQPSAGFSAQHGQFPYYVGEWLMRQFLNAGDLDDDEVKKYTPRGGVLGWGGTELDNSINFSSQNGKVGDENYYVTFEDLDFNMWFGGGVDLLRIPDFGYNVRLSVDYDNDRIRVTRKGRKGGYSGEDPKHRIEGADISLNYLDNAAGKRLTCGRGMDARSKKGPDDTVVSGKKRDQSVWAYGFDLQLFLGDIEEKDGVYRNRADDCARIKIVEKINHGATVESPFADLMMDEMEKSDAFDLPGWIEMVPVVGWALQNMINLIMWPFSNLVRPETQAGIGVTEDNVTRMREFEFLSVDDGLDYVDMADFPKLSEAFLTQGSYIPQVVALGELVGSDDLASIKTQHDTFMTQFFRKMAKEIGTNEIAWKHGACYDFLTPSAADYLIPEGQAGAGDLYAGLQVEDVDGEMRGVRNADMILGVSRDQYVNDQRGTPESTRVFYLDPAKFGGRYMSPPIYIKPIPYEGWMGLVQVLFPEYTPCKPHNTDLVDFDEIKQKVNERYPKIPDDPRLRGDEDCAVETPYNRIMDKTARAGMGGLIEAAIRIYASTHFFKAIGTFSKIMPKFPENYSGLYSQYIVEWMEEGFKDAQGDFWESLNPFKDDEFWYAFLEQSVQYYGWLVDEGEVLDPPPSVLSALKELNDLQDEYDFPWWEDWWEAVKLGDTTLFQGLKGYRGDKNLEAVQRSEELAKLVLKELVNIQLTYMGTQLVSNLRSRGFNPTIFDLDYWIFENQCNGTPDTDLRFAGPETFDEPVGLPTVEAPDPTGEGYSWPGPYYTPGGQFRISESNDPTSTGLGEEYIGFYHVHMDEDGDPVYMAGEYHSEEPHDALQPVNSLIRVVTLEYSKTKGAYVGGDPEQGVENADVTDEDYDRNAEAVYYNPVPIGDVPVLGAAANEDKPYYIEKYISVNGSKMIPDDAQAAINARGDVLISSVYPGTLKTVLAPPLVNAEGEEVPGEREVIGIEGELGVRYGLQFSYNHGGTKIPITSVEVDALDFACKNFSANIQNSKLLLCLINNLKEDPLYKMMVRYIFPLNKITSTLAIYNDMAFLSAVGEVTVGKGNSTAWIPTGAAAIEKPGRNSRGDWLNPIPRDDYWDVGYADLETAKVWQKRMLSKPGSIAFIKKNEPYEEDVPDPNWFDKTEEMYTVEIETVNEKNSGTSGWEGWQHYDDRQPGPWPSGWGVQEWDTWDRTLLRKSKSRVKKMFRTYYNSRNFVPGELDAGKNAGNLLIKNLKERLQPSPAAGLLSWFKRRKIRSNPFNAKGTLCDKPD